MFTSNPDHEIVHNLQPTVAFRRILELTFSQEAAAQFPLVPLSAREPPRSRVSFLSECVSTPTGLCRELLPPGFSEKSLWVRVQDFRILGNFSSTTSHPEIIRRR